MQDLIIKAGWQTKSDSVGSDTKYSDRGFVGVEYIEADIVESARINDWRKKTELTTMDGCQVNFIYLTVDAKR